MNLWIRSQDRESLCLCKEFHIEEFMTRIIILNGEGWNMGTYSSKQRALEVLDEIQNILKPIIITTNYECECKENLKDKMSFNLEMTPTKTEIQELSTYVYEMPKE